MTSSRRRKCTLLLLLIVTSCFTSVQAIHFPSVLWGAMDEQGPELQQYEQDTKMSDPTVCVNPQDAEACGETLFPSKRNSICPPMPDANGALLISLLWERGRRAIHNHIQMQRRTYERLFSLLLYKPPVGLVGIYSIIELVVTGRLFRVYNKAGSDNHDDDGHHGHPQSEQDEDDSNNKRRWKRRHRGRACNFEERDQSYVSYGNIERVRGRLCMAALADVVQEQEAVFVDFATARSSLFFQKRRQKQLLYAQTTLSQSLAAPWILATALDALHISCPPGGSRYDYVNKLRDPLAKLRACQVLRQGRDGKPSKPTKPDMLQVATRVLELRAMDALLRECRDQLLKVSYRLARSVHYWNRRVEQAKAMAVVQQSLIRETIEGDRLRLAYVQAAMETEMERLGRICEVLLLERKHPPQEGNKVNCKAGGRPPEMSDGYLLQALRRSRSEVWGKSQVPSEIIVENNPQTSPQSLSTVQAMKKWRSTWRLPKLSRYAIRIEKGWFKILKLEKDTFIGGPSATEVLMEDPHLAEWYADADSWIRQAKETLCDVLEETLDASVSERDYAPPSSASLSSSFRISDNPAQDIEWIRDAWVLGADNKGAGIDTSTDQLPLMVYNCTRQSWKLAMHLVEEARYARRVGEGRNLRFQDLSFVGWLSGFDLFGVPTVLARVYVAFLLHSWIAPRWPMIVAFVKEAWKTMVTIFLTRFWEPGRDVIMDILNREKSSMLDGFNLKLEEGSLDMMLHELNFGDGTPATRGEALAAATFQYEEDFKTGLFTNLASGQLVRLLLIQMQQVKVGMLQAIDDIDVLMQANTLNMRVMAVVPAVAIVWVVVRIIAKHLYNIRSRDLRPINKVHEEMTEHLHRMESILLLSSEARIAGGGTGDETLAAAAAAGLGEFVLRMHCYLVLLDFCSPRPFPKKQCDSLHKSLREVMGSIALEIQPCDEKVEQPSVATPVALLDLAIRRNRNLQKYL